ncbi:MAG: O-methyltransferase [Sphingobacteriales bacterium]
MFNLRFAKDYLLHRLKAKTRHGLHSPFVYRLADKIIYDFSAKSVYGTVESIRKKLLNDSRMITVTDLGAGSHVNNHHKKKISDIAKHALKPPRLAQLLYRLTHDLSPRTIVELGTCLGITTVYLQKAAPIAKVYTLEGCPETAAITRQVFNKAHAEGIELVTANFDDTLPGILRDLDTLDLVVIDKGHQKESVLKYFEWCLPTVHDGTLLIFGDLYRSEGMKGNWAKIKAHPKVTVTIDLFWIGLVYFKKGQAKEDFLVRF